MAETLGADGRKEHYLFPGQVIAVNDGSSIKTILGSCVAVALYDPDSGAAGLCHYLLPEVIPPGPPGPRYGTSALQILVNAVLQKGADRKNLAAKVFGGGAVVESLSSSAGSIGGKNVEVAIDFLERSGISVVENKTGGRRGRHITFCTRTFRVLHVLLG